MNWPIPISFAIIFAAFGGAGFQQNRMSDAARERAYAREQFVKSFREIQVTSQAVLREHNAKRLSPAQLSKDMKKINKAARTLRSLSAFGALAKTVEIDKEINTPEKFDKSIRRLASLIKDFAHNPHHQNSKVFNTDNAERAETDLLEIINLSRAIEGRAKEYGF